MGDNVVQKNKRRDLSNDLMTPEEKYSDVVSVSSVNLKSKDHTTTTTSTSTRNRSKPEQKEKEKDLLSEDEKKKDDKGLDKKNGKNLDMDDESTPLTALAQMNTI